MKKSVRIISIILIIIFVGTVILSLTTNLWVGEKINQQKVKRDTTHWLTFQSEALDFTFRYPPQALVDFSDSAVESEPKRVRVRLLGPQSKPNTEITDGFTFYVRSTVLSDEELLSDKAHQIFQAETENREVINPLNPSKVGDKKAYSFTVLSELDDEVIYEIIGGKRTTIFITVRIVSLPQHGDRNYVSIIERMQMSLHSL